MAKKRTKREQAVIDLGLAEDKVLGAAAVEEGLVKRGQVTSAKRAQEALLEHGYFFRIGELLVKAGVVELDRWIAFATSLGASESAPLAQHQPEEAPAEPATEEGSAEEEEADNEAVRKLLAESDHCLQQREIAEALGWGQRRAAGVISFLVDNGLIAVAKHGRAKVYWHPEFPYYPQWGLVGPVTIAKQGVSEEEILERATENLKSTLFVFEAERVARHELTHLPLWKVDLKGSFPEGLVFKQTRQRRGTLYFHGTRGHLCSLVPKTGLVFGAFAGEAPDSVQDLDEAGEWETAHPRELVLNPKVMDALKPAEQVQESLEQNFGMEVVSIDLVFLPCWKVYIEDKTEGPSHQRLLVVDGVLGMPVQL